MPATPGRCAPPRRCPAGDGRRRVRAAQHDAEQHAGQHDVVGVAARAFEQPRVLDAADGLGEAELGGRHDRVLPGAGGAVWCQHVRCRRERPRGRHVGKRIAVSLCSTPGSSSLKFAAYPLAAEARRCCQVRWRGSAGPRADYGWHSRPVTAADPHAVMEALGELPDGPLAGDIAAFGHRIVHGGPGLIVRC